MKIFFTLSLLVLGGSAFAQKYQYSGEKKGRHTLEGTIQSKHITAVKGTRFYWLTLADKTVINVTDSTVYNSLNPDDAISFASCNKLITRYNSKRFELSPAKEATTYPAVIADNKRKKD